MIRLYLPESSHPLQEGDEIHLGPDQSHYLSGVMRKSVGEAVLVFNGRDGEFCASITHLARKSVTLGLNAQTRVPSKTPGPILIIALIKRARLETIIEKATELGVSRIQILITRRTLADHTNIARLQAIAVEAAEQTERLDVPEILAPLKFEAFLQNHAKGVVFYGEENSVHEPFGSVPSFLTALQDCPLEGPYGVLIGPEGGFDEHERSLLQAGKPFQAVNLGPRILRADTAAISALTLLQAIKGDWKK